VGYLGANTQDGTAPGLNPGPPTFRDNLQIPFVGAYAAASYGGFLIDGQVRGDFFENNVSDDNHGLLGQHFNARGISLLVAATAAPALMVVTKAAAHLCEATAVHPTTAAHGRRT
jgi:hypothetical protein